MLIFDQQGTRDDGRVKMQEIDIYRDPGTSLELKNGLSGGERVVVSTPATRKTARR